MNPAYLDLAARIAQRTDRDQPLIVGLCGPQGSGKSTMAAALKNLLEGRGCTAAVLSIDDFYLSRADREVLARTVHPLFETRGVPGTHDVPLLLDVLASLQREGIVSVPRFDKAKDDRLPREQWEQVQAPVKVIILEGWCVGAVPQPEPLLEAPVNALEEREDPKGEWRRHVNHALGSEYRAVFEQIGLLILLAAPGFEVVYRWRLQQEEELRQAVLARGGEVSQVMDERALERFISHYERLTRYILEEMPQRADIVMRLDHERRMTVEARSG
ncbi:MAG TPA: hypothetical protein VF193_03755 [Steroidobacter sp.]